MKINDFNTLNLNQSMNKINNDIHKLADPSKTDNVVNAFIQDVYENDINTSLQEINNFNEAVGFMQIADGALRSISDNVSEIKTLQVAANNATLNNDNLAAINSQINKLSQNINDTLSQTQYNGKSVFGEFNFNGINVNTSMPEFSTENIDDFEKSLNSALSSVGAFNNEAVSKVNNLAQFVINTSNAKSQNETDIAKTVTDMKNEELKLNASILAQAHKMNISEQNLMNLLI
ncbi:putative flagellin [Nautilia profundicola AmH]|uniref:Flagellin n=1 Tax=Nautilia profundicola (strain ATCC BAA-1463 / DSM 18972 / AmH) TaxID=598659 RepID=B9L8P8_NAUPA|nr:flagellin [Nautilia profundicola]ACM93585.1 putative flagellin [Nautilia profundicola AmH]